MSAKRRKTAARSPSRGDERLRKARAMGRSKFILRCGILGWGLPMFVLFTVLPAFRIVNMFPIVATNPAIFVPLGALVWFGGGYFFGWWLWRMVSRQFASPEKK